MKLLETKNKSNKEAISCRTFGMEVLASLPEEPPKLRKCATKLCYTIISIYIFFKISNFHIQNYKSVMVHTLLIVIIHRYEKYIYLK